MDEGLYDRNRAAVLKPLIFTDDTTTVKQIRSAAHDATMEIYRNVCRELRKNPDLNLERALFLFGERL